MSALREALRELPDVVFADVLESEEAYLVVLDVPGVTTEALELSVDRRVLSVDVNRHQDVPDGFEVVATERPAKLDFELPIPSDASGRDAEASLDRGVLEITLPKRKETSTTIPVTE